MGRRRRRQRRRYGEGGSMSVGVWCDCGIGSPMVSSFRDREVGWDCGSGGGSCPAIGGCGSMSVGIWCDCGIGDGTRSSMVSSFRGRGREVGWGWPGDW